MKVKPIQPNSNYQNNCSMLEGVDAVSEETCLKCGFKCIEGVV